MRNYLIILFLTILISGCSVQSEEVDMEKFVKINTEYAKTLIENNPNLIILDVRTPSEYEAFHIEGAINIDFYDEKLESKLNELDKNETYLIYCRSGHRSGIVLDTMKKLNFDKVYELKGGILTWN